MRDAEKNISRYGNNPVVIFHKGHLVTTSVGSSFFDSFAENITQDISQNTKVGFIPTGYEHRPDVIFQTFFQSPKFWWLIMQSNSILDPFEELIINQRLVLPRV